METKHIKGLPVIDLADGVTQGTIERIYLNPTTKRVVGFGILADPDEPTPSSSLLVDTASVHTLGTDALTLTNTDAVRGTVTRDQLETLVEIDQLTKRQVVTETGIVLGQVVTIDLDPVSLEVERIELSPGFFKSNQWIPTEQIMRLGADVVVVAENVAKPMDEAMPPLPDQPAEMAAS